MTFTLSTKSRRVCAHPTSPFPIAIPHTVLFFSIRVSCRISLAALSLAPLGRPHRGGLPTAPPEAADCDLRLAAGGGASAAATARAAADMRPCRRRAWGAGGERARGAPTPLLSSTPPILLLRILLGCCARRLDRRGSSRGGGSGGGGGALGAAPLGSEGAGGAQPRRAARRAAAPKAQRWPAWRDACPPPVCWYHRAWHACHGARSLWQWPARCRSPTGPSQLPPTQRRLGCWLPSSFVRGRPPRRPERCRPRARRERRSSRRRAARPRRRAPPPARRRGARHHWRLGGGRRRRGKAG